MASSSNGEGPRVVDPAMCDPMGEPPSGFAPARRRKREFEARTIGLTPDGRLKSGRLAGLTMNRAIWVLSWPIFVESLLNSLVGFTDTYLAAGLGAEETDAIGGASYFAWFMGLAIASIGVGSTALISRAVGKGRLAVANAAVAQSVLLQLAVGVVVALVMIAALPLISVLLGLEGASNSAFRVYMAIMALSAPFMAQLFGGIACARGAGDSLRPLVIMTLVNLVNVPLSWILVGSDITRTRMVDGHKVTQVLLANPFDFDMGVAGIAIGTLVAYAVGALLSIGLLIRGRSGVRLIRRRLRPHWHTIARLVRLGWPSFLETFGMWAGNFLVLLMVAWIGQGMLGSHIVAIRIEAFSFLPGFAMGTAAATLAGQYLGAGSPVRARIATWRCTLVAGSFMGLLGLAFMLAPKAITGMVSPQDAHLETVPMLLVISGAVQLPFALSLVLRTALRGAGDVRMVMTLTWTCTYAIRLPAAYLLSGVDIPLPQSLGGGVIPNPMPWEPHLAGLWYGLCGEVVIRGGIFLARFLGDKWTKARV
ncbi:MAG: MATE family efflux transporter [Phycisphaeraceae bacterium]|nr:MATE family efflux transporter [Phycisphaeraceae bacterium]